MQVTELRLPNGSVVTVSAAEGDDDPEEIGKTSLVFGGAKLSLTADGELELHISSPAKVYELGHKAGREGDSREINRLHEIIRAQYQIFQDIHNVLEAWRTEAKRTSEGSKTILLVPDEAVQNLIRLIFLQKKGNG